MRCVFSILRLNLTAIILVPSQRLSLFPSLSGKHVRNILLCLLSLLYSSVSFAQKPADTSNKIAIEPHGDRFVHTTTDSGELNKFIGNVIIRQGENLMYCDSAYIDTKSNNLEGFGHVKIVQPGGTHAESDYLRYTSNRKLAYMRGDVVLYDIKSKLSCEELTYDLGTKTGVYTNGGTLESDSTTVYSEEGFYNAKSKDSRFTKNVYVTGPDDTITSKDLGYNSETKLITFFDSSIVYGKKQTLRTISGTYDSKNEVAHFDTRSTIVNEDQIIEADTIDYSSISGMGKAWGNVVSIDTTQHTTMYSGYSEYNRKTHRLFAYIKPVLKTVNGKDSLFIRADTFYSQPTPIASDSVKKMIEVKTKNKKGKIVTRMVADTTTTTIDSTRPRYFIGYHHVLIFSDSLQGRCDSISYSQKDSVIKMMYSPVAWARKSQITGDTILIYVDSSSIKRLYVPEKAFLVSQSGPGKANMYDQVQGKTLTGYFKDNELTHIIVKPNAESIYYAKDDSAAYLGVNQATSDRMKVYFNTKKIDHILFEEDVKQTMTPIQQANIGTMRLSRFHWLADIRPQSIEELFR